MDCAEPNVRLGCDNACDTAIGGSPELLGFSSVEEDDEVGAASELDSNVPNESSSLIDSKSAPDFGRPATTGNSSACGSGEGGAGHRPGLAAARSMRLRVCRCCDAFTLFSPT